MRREKVGMDEAKRLAAAPLLRADGAGDGHALGGAFNAAEEMSARAFLLYLLPVLLPHLRRSVEDQGLSRAGYTLTNFCVNS